MELSELEYFLKYADIIAKSGRESLSLEELASIWNKNLEETKRIVRKLRREGFVRRTRRGRYRLTLAGRVLVKLYERIKR